MTQYSLSILNSFVAERRRKFDPTNKKDLRELAYFKKNSRWQNGCPFYLEWPYDNIVSMCMSKFTDHALDKALK